MKKFKIISLVLSLVLILSCTSCSYDIEQVVNKDADKSLNGFTLHIIDVGQGDSILLECKNQYMLIDAGEYDKGNVVVSYLKNHNIDNLDYAVVTHPHSDHFGGMKTVLENVKTDNIVITEAVNTTRSWEKLIDYIDEQNYNVIFPKTNDTYKLGDSTITAYVPKVTDELNNCSIVMKAEYNGFSAILTGDAEKSEEELILQSGFDVSADVLKAGHHGSSTSTSNKFLEAVAPSVSLISCGKNNDYGHPHKETVKKLKENNIEMLRTDELGDIQVQFKDKITVSATNGYNNTINDTNDASSNGESKTAEKETYLGNKNSKKFHKKDCQYATGMTEKNKIYFSSRDEAINNGYEPCKSCNP